MTEPTRQLLDLPRIDVPIVNAPMARIAGGALAGAVSTATPASFTGWRCGRSSTSRVAQDTTQEVFVSLWEHPERIEPGRGTTAFRAGTCRCMTISTPSWPTCPRYATATST